MSISRRGFIGGIVAAVASGEALVKLADPREERLIKVGAPSTVIAPDGVTVRDIPPGCDGQFYLAVMWPGEGLRFEALGYAHYIEFQSRASEIDVTKFGGQVRELRTLTPSDRTVDMTFPTEYVTRRFK